MSKKYGLTRRTLVAGLSAGAAFCLPRNFAFGEAQDVSKPRIAKGYVREYTGPDAASLRGLSNVMVSNGREVTLSRDDGSWQLPILENGSIFVIKPPNWTSLDDAGVPDGLFQTNLCRSTSETGTINFFLRSQPEPSAFEALLVADTQAANAIELEYVRRELVPAARQSGARFAIHHGDTMGDDLALLHDYRKILEETGINWHHCPGNHDMDLGSHDTANAFESWRRIMGPTHYAFQYADATFILLNNIEYFGAGAPARFGALYRGSISADQLTFVANVLRHVPQDQLVVVSMHIPLASFANPTSPSDTTENGAELLSLLESYRHTVTFSGHSHTTEHHYLKAKPHGEAQAVHHHVLTAFCGSWWSGPKNSCGIPVADSRDGSPRGFHILSVDGNQYTTRYVSFHADSRQMRVLAQNESGVWSEARQSGVLKSTPGSEIMIDIFDGGPQTHVSCEIKGSENVRFNLTRVDIADPFIVKTYSETQQLLKPWVAPARSSHMWNARLPNALPAGSYAMTVNVTDCYGRIHVETLAIELSNLNATELSRIDSVE